MLILLPPSEGKTAPAGGARVELAALAFADELTAGKVVSHFVKAIRGDVARALLQAPEPARTPEDVAETAARAGLEVELSVASVDVITRN